MIVSSAWSANTDNEHFLRIVGLEQLIRGSEHKQEVVAGNLAEHLLAGMWPNSGQLEGGLHPFCRIQTGLRLHKRQVGPVL